MPEKDKLNFFARIFRSNEKQTSVESKVTTSVNESDFATVGKTIPQTIISYTSDQDQVLTQQQKQDLERLLATYPPLTMGEINFIPFEAGTLYGGYYVRLFIRNGKDLLEEFSMDDITVGLVDASSDLVAKGRFRPTEFGSLMFGETRIWTFAWRPAEVLKPNADLSVFTVTLG
ncbi:MAG TPA: SLAP domain-containing protein [Bacilli bacterium]|nr:SLAP domain-containing protein [Bacilli bacterium]